MKCYHKYLYEQMAAITENEKIKKTLLDIAKEEKTHVGESSHFVKRRQGTRKRIRRR